MLPRFRILIATIVLSASVLIFGLGAAALLRSAHEEFVGIPAWRAAQQPLVPAFDSNRPTLALVRVDPPPVAKAESKDNQPPKKEKSAKDDKPPVETKIASVDSQATDKAIVAEKSATEISKPDEVSKPRVRRAKRTRNVRNVKLIRHWSTRTSQTFQQQPTTNSAFTGFEASDATGSSGTGSNRRTAGRSPF